MGSCFEIYILKCTSVFGILASMLIATGIKNLDFHTANRAIGAAGLNIKKYISISMY